MIIGVTSELSLRQRKKLATRSALSHAAWSLMAEQGLDAATPEAVAEAANGSPRTFRNYFGSREKAILHGLVSRGTTLVDTMRARPAEEPVWDSLAEVLPAFTATFAVQRDDIAVLMRAVAENPAMRAQHFVAYEDAHQRLAEFIADRTGTDVERDLAPRLLSATAAAVLRTSVEIGARGETGAADSGGIYGSPRVHAVLKREGVHVGRKRVERLMREAEIAGISPRRGGFTRRDPGAALAPDLVERDFTAPAPNRLWVTDLTMITTGEGPLWLSAIREAFSRRVVAWETSARADADLVLTTLEYALASREVEPGKLIHHADHGCQYTSVKLTTRLLRAGVEASMGSVGDSCDNALAENLWMIIKTECIRGRVFATRAEANLALFEYIDGFYNSRRIQKRLGYLSPVESEEKHYADQATAERTNLKPRQPALTS